MRWTETWRSGYGPFVRHPDAVERLAAAAGRLVRRGVWPDEESVCRLLAVADRQASAAMWLAVHMTHARRVDTSGAALPAEAFKDEPQGLREDR